MSSTAPALSVVIPLYNEAESLEPLVAELGPVLDSLGWVDKFMAEGQGVKPDLWIGEDPPSSSLPPLVALEAALAQGPAVQRELLRAMRRAAFVEGINIARRDVQLELASRVGLDLHGFVEALDDASLEQSVTGSAEEAESLGIRGVPALVIGGEWLMQGCRDISEYRHVIDKYLRERRSGPPPRTIH